MYNLNICIDIDGTITEPYYWLNEANKFFNLNVKEEDITEYDISKVLDITNDELSLFYKQEGFRIYSKEKIRDIADEVIDILYKYHHVFLISERDKSFELLTNQYLRYHRIPSNKVIFVDKNDKVSVAKNRNCDIFIEDCYETAVKLAENNFNVLLIDTNYNRKPLPKNIKRVYNWHQIYTYINNYEKEEVLL